MAVSDIVIGLNSYGTLAEADDYLADSIRAAAWESIDPDTKKKALLTATRLLEKQTWQGSQTPVEVIVTIGIGSGGTGYVAGDILTLAGGTFGAAAQVEVTMGS